MSLGANQYRGLNRKDNSRLKLIDTKHSSFLVRSSNEEEECQILNEEEFLYFDGLGDFRRRYCQRQSLQVSPVSTIFKN